VDATVSADSRSAAEYGFEIDVPRGATALVVTISNDDSPNLKSGAGTKGVTVRINSPDGESVDRNIVYASSGPGAIAVPNPQPGPWHVTVLCGRGKSARVNAAAYLPTFSERLRSLGRRFACRSCPVFLTPIVIWAVVHVIAALLPIATVATVTASLGHVFGPCLGATIPPGAMPKFIEIILGYASHPLDNLVHRVCQLIHACP
jgi:hypothetical protein